MKTEIQPMTPLKRWLMATGILGATALALSIAKGEEAKLIQKQITSANSIESKVNGEDFSYLTNHSERIDLCLKYFQALHPEVKGPEKNMILGQVATESGGPKDRKNDFVYDPMSISHQDDSALQVLANRKDCSWLIGDFTCLKDNKNAQRVNGKWNYQNTRMNANESVFGGIGWLYHNAAIYENRTFENGETKTYVINYGDSFDKISKKLKTTADTLLKYNPDTKPTRLKVGQKVQYKEAVTKAAIVGWRSWTNAVERYNGDGDPNYLSKVLTTKEQLDKGK